MPVCTGLGIQSFCTPSTELRTDHLHVIEESFSGWPCWLAFREDLRMNPDVSLEYGELTTRLTLEYGSDPNERTGIGMARQIGSVP